MHNFEEAIIKGETKLKSSSKNKCYIIEWDRMYWAFVNTQLSHKPFRILARVRKK